MRSDRPADALRRLAEHSDVQRPTNVDFMITVPTEVSPRFLSVPLLTEQRRIYSQILNELGVPDVLRSLHDRGDALKGLAKLLRLRQVCAHPRILERSIPLRGSSAKFEALCDILEESLEEDHKVIVFTQWAQMATLIMEMLSENKIAHSYIDGSVSIGERAELVQAFQRPDGPSVRLISLLAGGEGTIAVLQQKGGSGKTTLAINLAAAAHLDGQRTLVVDMDRQASAFDWSSAREDGSPLDGLAVVKADRAIALPRFREIVRGYDYVFLDGPPRLGDVTRSAAVAADVALLPTQPGPFDFWAVAETLESLDQADQIREQRGRKPIRRVFVVNRAGAGTRLAREAEDELRKSGGELAGVVHQRVAFPEAASRGEFVLASRSADAAIDDIQRLWRALKGGTHGPEPQETEPRTKRETSEGGRREARRGREAHRRGRA